MIGFISLEFLRISSILGKSLHWNKDQIFKQDFETKYVLKNSSEFSKDNRDAKQN